MKHIPFLAAFSSLAPTLDHECMPTNAALLSALQWVLEFADNVLHITITWTC